MLCYIMAYPITLCHIVFSSDRPAGRLCGHKLWDRKFAQFIQSDLILHMRALRSTVLPKVTRSKEWAELRSRPKTCVFFTEALHAYCRVGSSVPVTSGGPWWVQFRSARSKLIKTVSIWKPSKRWLDQAWLQSLVWSSWNSSIRKNIGGDQKNQNTFDCVFSLWQSFDVQRVNNWKQRQKISKFQVTVY